MNRKTYFIIGSAIAVIIIAITIFAFLSPKSNSSWLGEISNANSFEIIMSDCNGREKTLSKDVITNISNNWNKLSNNGPWMGDNNKCYKTVTISYENNGIINEKEILLIDETSLVLSSSGSSTYYTNASEIRSYLEEAFSASE